MLKLQLLHLKKKKKKEQETVKKIKIYQKQDRINRIITVSKHSTKRDCEVKQVWNVSTFLFIKFVQIIKLKIKYRI